jgi:hypothetical protein
MSETASLPRSKGIVGRLIDRVFFPELPPLNLAICRIVLGAWVLYYFSSGHGASFVRACVDSSPDLFRPIGVVTLLDKPISPQLFHLLYRAMFASAVCFLVGFGHRFLALIFALLQLFLWTYRNSWGFIYHTENT